jgi:hypothetical protein
MRLLGAIGTQSRRKVRKVKVMLFRSLRSLRNPDSYRDLAALAVNGFRLFQQLQLWANHFPLGGNRIGGYLKANVSV